MSLLDDYPPLLTVKQVAKIFQVTPLTIKRWGKKGILPPIRINSRGDRRYTKEQVLWLIGQKEGDKATPSVNKKLYEVEQKQSNLDATTESTTEIKEEFLEEKIEEKIETPPALTRHAF